MVPPTAIPRQLKLRVLSERHRGDHEQQQCSENRLPRERLCLEPVGMVAPRLAMSPSEIRSTSAATSAPTTCATQYDGSRRAGNRRVSASPSVTAGLKCAPDT